MQFEQKISDINVYETGRRPKAAAPFFNSVQTCLCGVSCICIYIQDVNWILSFLYDHQYFGCVLSVAFVFFYLVPCFQRVGKFQSVSGCACYTHTNIKRRGQQLLMSKQGSRCWGTSGPRTEIWYTYQRCTHMSIHTI
jgi:hypothetical protein